MKNRIGSRLALCLLLSSLDCSLCDLMTSRQMTFVGILAFIGCVLIVGPTVVSSGAFIVVLVIASAVVWPFADYVTPKNPNPPSPLKILQQSRIWRGVAIVYTVVIVVVVIWHLLIHRLAFFDDVPFALMLVLLLGPAVGPIATNIVITYQLLGKDG